MASRKVTTGLVGLSVALRPREKLISLYNYTLKALTELPPTYEYRVKTETLTKHRLDIVNSNQDIEAIEQKINAGQIEQVIQQGKAELFLARNIKRWQPWSSLERNPPPDQWKWP